MSTSGRVVDLLRDIDRLYESVVSEPALWDEATFAEWLEAAVADGESLNREALKILRRVVRRAQRLQRHWAGRSEGPDNWRMRVDDALGSAGWRPGLELAEWGMGVDPNPELFAELSDRFRAVNFAPIALDFEQWLEGRDD